ncbi:LuxR C-terminal-related transcriptional regulator [Kitasatospora sp. NPDC088346]|uniref:LuxR C-terminal-related transcriptional regulator n=1 Tax=Kitasatospora sp. NPDC088346 TaxID=3364073 RepID=UPI0037FE25DC
MQNPARTGSSAPGPTRAAGSAPARAPSGDPILAARFAVPALPGSLVRRPALLARLTEGVQGPLTFVNGPAGAGKTLLAAHWLAEGRRPAATAWLTVEPGDAPGTFWAHLLAALHRHGVRLPDGPDGDGDLDGAPNGSGPNGGPSGHPAGATGAGVGPDRLLLSRLAEGLARSPEPVVLVLDQFDAIPSRAVADGLAFVLRHSAGGLRLVLLGRSEPLLPLHRYRAAGEVTEIRNADLRFSPADAETLLRDHGLTVSRAAVQTLTERTDGWAAGIRLCALAMQRAGDPESFVREFAADRAAVADYLLAEVLEAQPPATQDLLLRVSVAGLVHPDLADALTGRRDGEWTLARLARSNAFVEPVDGSAWYRMHPLFAEVLRAHLRHRHPGLEPRLHHRAARWLAADGRITEAVAQAADAGDWRFAAEQLVAALAVGRLVTGPDAEPLGRLLAAMPAGLDGPAPALVEAARRLAAHDLDGFAAHLRHAEGQLTAADPAARLGAAVLAVLGGRAAGDPRAAARAAADADRLLREVPPELLARHPEVPATVLAAHGAAELDAGHLAAAAARLTAAVAACGPAGTPAPHGESLGALALVELERGRLRRAETHARGALAVAERSVLPPRGLAGVGHLVLAGVATEHDDLATARNLLDLVAGPPADPVAAVRAAVTAARLATAAGDPAGALAALRAAAEDPRARALPAWTADGLAVAESAVHLARHDPAAALAVLDGADPARPAVAAALARALLAAGRPDAALATLGAVGAVAGPGLPADQVPVPDQVAVWLARAEAAERLGDPAGARRQLALALGLARPEELRRRFVEAGPWVGRVLGRHPQLAREHGWLPGRLLRPAPTQAAGPLPAVVEPLSPRELEVLGQAAQLLSTEEIAAELYVSANTVKTHLKSIYRKLGAARRSEAVHRARELGLL